MKTYPWAIPEDLHPDLRARAAEVLEVHADQQAGLAHGLGQCHHSEPARVLISKVLVMTAIVPEPASQLLRCVVLTF